MRVISTPGIMTTQDIKIRQIHTLCKWYRIEDWKDVMDTDSLLSSVLGNTESRAGGNTSPSTESGTIFHTGMCTDTVRG